MQLKDYFFIQSKQERWGGILRLLLLFRRFILSMNVLQEILE